MVRRIIQHLPLQRYRFPHHLLLRLLLRSVLLRFHQLQLLLLHLQLLLLRPHRLLHLLHLLPLLPLRPHLLLPLMHLRCLNLPQVLKHHLFQPEDYHFWHQYKAEGMILTLSKVRIVIHQWVRQRLLLPLLHKPLHFPLPKLHHLHPQPQRNLFNKISNLKWNAQIVPHQKVSSNTDFFHLVMKPVDHLNLLTLTQMLLK